MRREGGRGERGYGGVTPLLDVNESLILMGGGGGAIHGDYRDYLDYNGRVAYMHTGLIQEVLPEGKHLVSSGEVLDIMG